MKLTNQHKLFFKLTSKSILLLILIPFAWNILSLWYSFAPNIHGKMKTLWPLLSNEAQFFAYAGLLLIVGYLCWWLLVNLIGFIVKIIKSFKDLTKLGGQKHGRTNQ